MLFLTNTLMFIASITNTLLGIYSFVVIAACLISWVNPDPYNPIVRFLYRATQPAFSLIRRYLPFTVISGFDLSPIVLLLAIQFVKQVIIMTIQQMLVTMH